MNLWWTDDLYNWSSRFPAHFQFLWVRLCRWVNMGPNFVMMDRPRLLFNVLHLLQAYPRIQYFNRHTPRVLPSPFSQSLCPPFHVQVSSLIWKFLLLASAAVIWTARSNIQKLQLTGTLHLCWSDAQVQYISQGYVSKQLSLYQASASFLLEMDLGSGFLLDGWLGRRDGRVGREKKTGNYLSSEVITTLVIYIQWFFPGVVWSSFLAS